MHAHTRRLTAYTVYTHTHTLIKQGGKEGPTGDVLTPKPSRSTLWSKTSEGRSEKIGQLCEKKRKIRGWTPQLLASGMITATILG